MNKELRIVFMGTPDFAVAPLRALVDGGYNVVAVVTTPDKPAGRGLRMHESAVKQFAAERGLPVLQPVRLKDETFVDALRELDIDLAIVVAFRMLPEAVWGMPRLGTFNLHASLLPQYRGAAPINWAVINGERESGVTTFFLNNKMDEGRIIDSRKVDIAPEDSAGTLHDKLMEVGAALVLETVDAIAAGDAVPREQPAVSEGELRGAPKIFKETGRIDFDRRGAEIINLIRGLSPYPGAWGEMISVSEASRNAIAKIAGGSSASLAPGAAGRLPLDFPGALTVKILAATFEPLAEAEKSSVAKSKQALIESSAEISAKFSADADCHAESRAASAVLPNMSEAKFGPDSALWEEFMSRPSSVVGESHTMNLGRPASGAAPETPGTILSDGRTFIKVACADGYISITDLQIAGKKRMSAAELLRGFRNITDYRFR